MKQIHINCDLGEGGNFDQKLMPLISACNIACGGHAGNRQSMSRTISAALDHGVEIGAHPSFPDKEQFGRRIIPIASDELKTVLKGQLKEFLQITRSLGGKISHIKAHGALYNGAARDEQLARILLEVIEEFDQGVSLYVPPGSVIERMAKGKVPLMLEAFADRNYQEDLRLVPRSERQALITSKEAVFEHLFLLFTQAELQSINGISLTCKADTFCLHSDTPDAVEILQYLKQRFAAEQIKIKNT